EKGWERASLRHNGAGIQHGGSTYDLKMQLKRLREYGKHQMCWAILAAACAGAFGEDACNLCERGEIADDFLIVWGECCCRSERSVCWKTEDLVHRARQGQHEWAAFWLRGITPRSWATPPVCETEYQPTRSGSAANITNEEHGDKLNLTEGVMACGDGSGGKHGGDARCRRNGWSWTIMQNSGGIWQEAAIAHGPLPGARQSNNGAEIAAVLDCLQSTEGDLVFTGWDSRKYIPMGYQKAHGDLWKTIRQRLEARGVAEVPVRHIGGHMTIEQEAAATHGIPRAHMGCRDWARAAAHNVRTRIGHAYVEQLERTKPMAWEGMAEAKLRRKPSQLEI
ncbi:unnamed protein product, partial [Prorocentrum cordatum]